MDLSQYEDFLSFSGSKSLPLAEWTYPASVKSSEDRKAYPARAEHLGLGTKNVGTSDLEVNRKLLMYQVEVKLDGVLVVQESEIPTQQMVTQELAPLHVGLSVSAEHITRVRTQVDCVKAAGFFFLRSQGGLQAAVER